MSKYLSLFVFPVLSALALKLTFGNLMEAGMQPYIEQNCPPLPTSAQPHRLNYTGFDSVDGAICGLVYFFHLALTPDVLPFLTYFMGNFMPLAALLSFESFRQGRHPLLAFPVVFGLLMQVMTVGAKTPIYWLIFILTGAAQRQVDGPKTTITSAHAQSVAFGLFIGAVVPTVCLVVLEDSHVTAIWQLFPLWQYLAQSAHLLVCPASTHKESGYPWVQALYIAAFVFGSSVHVGTLAKANTLEGVKAALMPSLNSLNSAPPHLKVKDFLQWDAFFGFSSTLLATLWFAENASQIMVIALWNIFASVLLGPGAAIAAIALWRESNLHRSSPKEKSQ
ncbi:hypothetical protein FB45DRAFT_1037239 [Roridomyces roridus]|uniref:Uncharacterized protein n=1 Tax=Roridomyces roridus TaxID=1738132 RepID=A0AAD7B6F4_9AGAR|nr:hypothetical protein FB45DRAFT_1037239 [Roridomyces roridus]